MDKFAVRKNFMVSRFNSNPSAFFAFRIPAKAGVHSINTLGSRLRGNDKIENKLCRINISRIA